MIILSILALGFFFYPALGVLDHPGLQKDWDIKTGNYTFHLVTVSNFDVTNMTFNKENKEIILDVTSPHEQNLAEIQIPHNLIAGNLTAFVNGTQIYPKIQQDNRISFLTINFDNKGENKVHVIGTTYLPEFSGVVLFVMIIAFITIIISTRIRKF